MHLLPKRAPARVLGPIVGALARAGVTPNQISVAGFLGNVGAAALIANGQLMPAGIVVLVASALDMLDGGLARATGRATPFGGVLDSTLDRLSEATVLFGVLWYEIELGHQEESLLAFAAVVGSMMVSYIRARVEAAGGALTDGLFTRSERVVVTGVALIFGWLRPALWLLAVLTLATAVQRLYLAAGAVRERHEGR